VRGWCIGGRFVALRAFQQGAGRFEDAAHRGRAFAVVGAVRQVVEVGGALRVSW
jgi:hypothetical protein